MSIQCMLNKQKKRLIDQAFTGIKKFLFSAIVVFENHAGDFIDKIALSAGGFLRNYRKIANKGILKKDCRRHIHGIADRDKRIETRFSGAAFNMSDKRNGNTGFLRQLFLRETERSSVIADSFA